MPFKSEKQRRYLWANEPEVARKWAKNYQDGGLVANNDSGSGFVTVDGQTVILNPPQVISDQGEDITNTPRGQNLLAKARSGYSEEQTAATEARNQRNVEAFGALLAASPQFLLESVPIIGDAIAAKELYDELHKNPINWVVVGMLGGATLIGLFPGIGDAAAAGIKAGARALKNGSTDAVRALKNKNLDYVCNYNNGGVMYYANGSECKIVSTVGRTAKARSWFIQNKDGSVEEISLTPKEFQEQFGVGVSGSKKERGRTSDGRQWSKTGEFKEFKSGAAKLDAKPVDPTTLEYSTTRARLPKIDAAMTDKLEDAVDGPVYEVASDRVQNSFVDYPETADTAASIGDEAWPKIYPAVQEIIKDLPVEKQNTILQWARNRSRMVWGKMDVYGKGEDITPHVQIPSVFDRVDYKEATGKKFPVGKLPRNEVLTSEGLTVGGILDHYGESKKWQANQYISQLRQLKEANGGKPVSSEDIARLMGPEAEAANRAALAEKLAKTGAVEHAGKTYNYSHTTYTARGKGSRPVIIQQFDYPAEDVDAVVKFYQRMGVQADAAGVRGYKPEIFEELVKQAKKDTGRPKENPATAAHNRWLEWARENYDTLSYHHKQIVDNASK